ncbi:MAG: ABC transporter permease [Pyrinomonadaceae bacterium]
MKLTTLIKRGLTHYWRTNLAVVAGVGVAVAVLAGALLVGSSVRASLRELALGRLGATDYVIASGVHFFREELAEELRAQPGFAANGFGGACPLVAIDGALVHEQSGRRSARVQVYGVDERFWQFHDRPNNLSAGGREVAVSAALAAELGAAVGEALLLRVGKPSAIPAEFLHGRRDDAGRTLRLSLGGVLDQSNLGEFSLRPQQGAVHAVFVPLALLQRELDQEGRVNTILLSASGARAGAVEDAAAATARAGALERLLQETFTPADAGVKIRALDQQQALSVESESGVISSALAASVGGGEELFSYLANSIRADDGREVPYSLVTAVDAKRFEALQHAEDGRRAGCGGEEAGGDGRTSTFPPIVLNDWAAGALEARPGDRVTLDYYLWLEEGRLATRSAEFRVACVVPMQGFAADRDLTPEYPGITESESLADWDPPFPVDLKRVRPQDEDYWKKYRATPKAFIPLEVGQRLWQTRFGKLTSIRLSPTGGQTLAATRASFEQSLRAQLVPTRAGFSILPVRAEGLAASRGATDFGEYFLYFSFFLVVSALMLAGLFFKLGVEQRLRELGLLRALGFPGAKIRALFLSEGALLALVGSALGAALALGYGALVMLGLRTWWVDAVGTRSLSLHFEALPFVAGASGGLFAALIFIWWTLRRVLAQGSTRGLLAGEVQSSKSKVQGSKSSWRGLPSTFSEGPVMALVSGAFAFGLLFGAWSGVVGDVAGFFGAGVLLLVSALSLLSWRLKRGAAAAGRNPISGGGAWALARMGARFATHRPGRSVLCVALVATAAFIIVAVEAFRREGPVATDRKSGTGGYALLAETLLPVAPDPNIGEGREALNLTAGGDTLSTSGVQFARFRLKPGDDASCLNLYQPQNPRVVGATSDFIQSNRFSFQSSLAATDEEQNNPWLLLEKDWDGAVPVVADANSLTYVLHRKVGDEFATQDDAGQTVRLRVVGALSDSLFQSELVTSERHFLRAFPSQEGFRFFLLDVAQPESLNEVSGRLEESLSDYGFDAQAAAERLANFHRVENTYLSTFQTLGALGLALGTLGLAAVLLRNVLERRRELALLRAVGYGQRHLALMVIAESALLLCAGLVVGVFAALLAVAPAFAARGGELFKASLVVLLLVVLVVGLLASLLATVAALRAPLLKALRAE